MKEARSCISKYILQYFKSVDCALYTHNHNYLHTQTTKSTTVNAHNYFIQYVTTSRGAQVVHPSYFKHQVSEYTPLRSLTT